MTTRLLFVCLGNICRSPAAEGIMQTLVKKNGLESEIKCDSAGTYGHVGSPPDARMQQHAQKRGYVLNSQGRRFDPKRDFEAFDLILTMDEGNLRDIRQMDYLGVYQDKIQRMCHFCLVHSCLEVPDPYYGGAKGFENVLDLLEDAAQGLLEQLRKNGVASQ